MERSLSFAPPRVVRAAMARAVLGAALTPYALGEVTLHRHQRVAVDRLRVMLAERRCALLADAVGLGKTFVAAALAGDASHALVIGPASLRAMWTSALGRAHVSAGWLSYETLSRRAAPHAAVADLVILDEAHHARTPTTRRYRAIAELVAGARVLFLSATPVHNHRRDLAALVALAIGSRAFAMSDAELSRFVLRRERGDIGDAAPLPGVSAPRPVDVGDDGDLLEAILRLPPPVPPSDGGDAGALLAMSLAKQWASSRAALDGALRRMLARGAALAAALEEGTRPSRRELEHWLLPESGAVQLAFAALLAPVSSNTAPLLDAVRRHESAVRDLLARARDPACRIDERRADALRSIRIAHRGASIVAFSAYTDTIRALFASLRGDAGVAALSARGATVAGGRLTRAEAFARFAPNGTGVSPPREIERITLLLTTDLSSEGVNLQDAAVVVHLDIPWTAARLEQRVGRSRRLGATHAETTVYTFAPPADAERLLALERRIRHKLGDAQALIGTDVLLFADANPANARSAARLREELARRLAPWLTDAPAPLKVVSAVRAPVGGALALVRREGALELIAVDADDCVTSDPGALLALVDVAGGAECVADAATLTRVVCALRRSLAAREAASRAGAAALISPARRAATRRIAAVVGATPFHRRAELAVSAARALRAATAPMGIAGEWSLRDAARGEDDRSLLSRLGASRPADHNAPGSEILALLLLSATGSEAP